MKRKDYGLMIGERFGLLTIISNQFYDLKYHKTRALIKGKCDCGDIRVYECSEIRRNKSRGCPKCVRRAGFGRWRCSICNDVLKTRAELFRHRKEVHNSNQRIWNKGKSAKTDFRIANIASKIHEKNVRGEIHHIWAGKHLPDEIKTKISLSMKKAHREGRAHNIGTCRWNNKPSYPEEFFIRVIKNNFIDHKYSREFPFIKYSLDFAWEHKRRCIEIDGEQHERFSSYKERDRIKDELLESNGWKVLRIKWRDMFNNPKDWIEIA